MRKLASVLSPLGMLQILTGIHMQLLFDNEETRITVFAVFTSTPAKDSDSDRGNNGGEGGNGTGGKPTCGGPPDGCIRSF